MYDKSSGSTTKQNCKRFMSMSGIRRRIVSLMSVGSLPMLLGANCGLETCDIFNCDTLPFIEELLALDEHAEDMHDHEEGQMDVEDEEEHVDDTPHDDEDEQMVDDEETHDADEEQMHEDHDSAARALGKFRDFTRGHEPPNEACNTSRVWLDDLRELEADLHRHVYKENNILFPMAIHHQAAIANHGRA